MPMDGKLLLDEELRSFDRRFAVCLRIRCQKILGITVHSLTLVPAMGFPAFEYALRHGREALAVERI